MPRGTSGNSSAATALPCCNASQIAFGERGATFCYERQEKDILLVGRIRASESHFVVVLRLLAVC